MATLNPPKPITRRQELRQDKVVTVYAKAWAFFNDNKMVVYGLLAGLVLVIAGIIGYVFMQAQRGDEAQVLLGNVIPVYEQGNYQAALDGIETGPGLLEIADDFSGTDAGNLAHYYAADALFRLGRYDEALDHFEEYEKAENLVGASALAGEAAIYEVKGEYERAGDLYRRAASIFSNEVTSPEYLLLAGQAYEAGGDYDEALEAYETITENFPESALASGIEFYTARVRAKMR